MSDSSSLTPARLFDESEARRLAEASLRSITLSTSRARGEDFFRQLVKDLAAALDVFYVIAGEVCSIDGVESVRTLAVWAGEGFMPNISYGLACTPCRNVADQSMCFHPSQIQHEYPEDLLLVDMKAESYIGMPMVGTDGKTLGILVALDVRPMDENKRLLALSLLSIFSARCAAELEHQRREAELEQLVEQRTKALDDARERLVEREKLAALGGLVAGMAHEINTPVGIAVTASSTLESYAKDLAQALSGEKVSRNALMEISKNLQHGADLVQRNLMRASDLVGNFKKLAVDQASEGTAVIVVGSYLNSLCGAHSPEFKKHQASAKIDVEEGLRAKIPPGMLAQILSNLIMNALIHGLDKSSGAEVVSVSAKREGHNLRLIVADNGVGVAPEVRARMMEPFFTTKRGQGGTGLGLHIVYTLVQRLGGTLDLKSAPGQGLEVSMLFPDCLVA